MRVCFRYLEKAAFSVYAASLFQILAGNMSAIAPTGNPRSKDYAAWKRAVTEGLNSTARRIILIYAGEPEHIVGYFQYSADKELFMMEEIQIAAPYQHKHAIFRRLYAYALENLEAISQMMVEQPLQHRGIEDPKVSDAMYEALTKLAYGEITPEEAAAEVDKAIN